MDQIIQRLEKSWLKEKPPSFRVGDTVQVSTKVVEGGKERIQIFEGTVIARKRGGNRAVFTVRKISYGVGVEKIFPIHSPYVQEVKVVRQGFVKMANLYYLRSRSKKASRIRERGFIRKKKTSQPLVVPDPALSPEEPGEPETSPSGE